MPRLLTLLLTILGLVGCAAVTVDRCGPDVADFLLRKEHRSLVIHPQGCYIAWDQTRSPFEAERRALLLCSENNPESDAECRVVATDNFLCPLTLEDWISERRQADAVSDVIMSRRKCAFSPPFEVKSAPGTAPPALDASGNPAIGEALTAFGLDDYEPDSGSTIVFGRAPETRSNWIVHEGLRFVTQKDGERTCLLRLANGSDPRFGHFDTVFAVQLVGCFTTGG